jgi:hypothetical protein
VRVFLVKGCGRRGVVLLSCVTDFSHITDTKNKNTTYTFKNVALQIGAHIIENTEIK